MHDVRRTEIRRSPVGDWVRNLFRSGAVFMIAAALSLVAGVLYLVRGLVIDNGSAFMGVAGTSMSIAALWFIIAIAVKRKNIAKNRPDTES
jgi:hypothetical protein